MVAIPHWIEPREYLEIETQSTLRHEYRRGLVYAMAGSGDNHDRIAFNLLREIDNQLGDSPCRFYSGNVKVNYQEDFYYYPDAFVTCDCGDRADRYIKRHPKLIAEVLSPSTETFDRGHKFTDYQHLASLEEYLLISQNQPQVEVRRRIAPGTWETSHYGPGDSIPLVSLGFSLPIEQLYRGLDPDLEQI